ncbi:MAG: hypothetical protein ABI472_23295 [Ginsengibacter sp.]
MQLTLLYIRLKQLQRELRSLGMYMIAIAAIALYLILVSFSQFETGRHAYYIVGGLVIICVALQFYRKDTSFIYKHVDKPHLQIFSEYAAISLPFSVTAIFTKSWMYFPLLATLLFLIPYLKFSVRKKTIFKNLSRVIPAMNFEWISGFRKSFILFIGVYLLAVAFCWFRILPLFLLWFLTTIIISFYSECESIQVLRESGETAGKFLLHKLYRHSIYIVILYTPLILINTIFNPGYLLINLLFVPVQVALLCFAIGLKYSSYRPNSMQTANNMLLTIIAFLVSLPYLLPLPAVLSFLYFYKARNNLKYYLND